MGVVAASDELSELFSVLKLIGMIYQEDSVLLLFAQVVDLLDKSCALIVAEEARNSEGM